MKNYIILISLLLSSCVSTNVNHDLNKNFIFSEKMTFEEFTIKVDRYANESPYPNLNE